MPVVMLTMPGLIEARRGSSSFNSAVVLLGLNLLLVLLLLLLLVTMTMMTTAICWMRLIVASAVYQGKQVVKEV